MSSFTSLARAARWTIVLLLGSISSQDAPSSRPAGDISMSARVDNRDRNWILHIPKSYDGAASRPLVFMFHGGFGNAKQAADQYHWREKSDAEGFFVAFPQGVGLAPTWNAGYCCGAASRDNVNDILFVKTIFEELLRTYPIDTSRIYTTGMSNGAMFSYRLAAECSDWITAAAPVAGSIGGRANARAELYQIPNPKNPVPMFIIHGKLDKNVLYHGGLTEVGAVLGREDMSVAQSVQFWVKANGCETRPSREVSKSGNVIKEKYTNSKNGAAVELITIENAGHSWPGGRRGSKLLDLPSAEFNATDEIWKFFSKIKKVRAKGD